MKTCFLILITVFHSIDAISQKVNPIRSPEPKATKISTLEPNIDWTKYLVVSVSKKFLGARFNSESISFADTVLLNDFISKIIGKVNKDKVAIEFTDDTSLNDVSPVFNLLRRHEINRWSYIKRQNHNRPPFTFDW